MLKKSLYLRIHIYIFIYMKATLLIVLLLLVVGWPMPVAAGMAKATLDEALQAALGEHPLLLAARADVAAKDAAYRASASQYLPRLTLSETFYATNEPAGSLFINLNQEKLALSPTADAYNDPPDRHDFETRLSLTQPLFDPAVYYGKERASVTQQMATDLLQRQREETAYAVLRAYLDVQKSTARLDWAGQYLAEAEEVLSLSRERETAGVGLHADTLRSEVLLYDAKRNLLSSTNDLTMARSRLAVAMGRPDGEIDIAAPLRPNWLPVPSVTGVLQRGDLDALSSQVRESELAAKQQWSSYLPKAGLQASYILHDEDTPFGAEAEAWSVSAGLQWMIFDFSERSHLLKQARARQRALELQRDDRMRQAHLEIRAAVLKAGEAEALLELARGSHAASDAARKVVVERFTAGLATLSELLEVQAELARSRSALAEAEVNLVTTRANIHYQEGSLLGALKIQSEDQP